MSPTTIDRLKALPLTIVLTILIWMYAEAKFTATGDARVSIRPIIANGDLALRIADLTENRFLPTLTIVATLQGPTNQITSLQQEAEPTSLTFTPPASALAVGTNGILDTVTVLNSMSSIKKRGLTAISATPSKIRLEVDRLAQITRPVDFRPAVMVEHIVGLPDQAMVMIPARTLQEIGGAERLTVVAVPSRNLTTLPIGQPQTISMRFVPEYPGTHDDRVMVTPAQAPVTLTVSKRDTVTQVVPDVPVWVSGPPALLARYDVDLRPKFVPVTVSGTDPAIRALKAKIASGARGNGGGDQGIHAYLDVSLEDRPGNTFARRALRYVLPEGLTVQEAPAEVEFRLVEVAGSQPTGAVDSTGAPAALDR